WVHPHVISAVALALGVSAGVSYWLTKFHPGYYVLGAILVALSGIADSLDGIVARMTGRTSRVGDLLDHFFDRLVEMAVMVGLATAPGATTTFGMGVTIAGLLSGYLGTQIVATYGQRDYSSVGRGELFIGLIIASIVFALWPNGTAEVAGRSMSYLDIFFAMVAVSVVVSLVQRLRLAFRLAGE
ncbi:MAG TPA: CDP-alcohol phosphatidyltransferase family protein, partial [Chondromyces sp.]|nr:CDP-alcohol phosphatidyltransferase family protein [Chondromyces sp.]